MLTTLATLLLLGTWLQTQYHRAPRVSYDVWHGGATARGLVVEWISMNEAIARSVSGTVKGSFDNERGRGWLA